MDMDYRPSPWRLIGAVALLLMPLSCSKPAVEATPALQAHEKAAASFINKVWSVTESSAVAPGSLYVYLAGGALVIVSPGSTPLLGSWRQENGVLTMVEESLPYKVDVLKLEQDEFRIRIHNPGEPVTITFTPAAGLPARK